MKIDNSLKSTGGLAKDGIAGKNPKTEAVKPEAGVSVELSGLSALAAQAASGEVVDAAHVAEIKQAISEGRFKVNPDVVADRLLQTVQELIATYKR
jgi:negative regulator of flagellin synthesis FlgM